MPYHTRLPFGVHPREVAHHLHVDPHRQASDLSDVILGGQDGIVNVLGVILGVAAATGDPRIVLVAGLAAAFAESVSMAAVAYTSRLAEADFYESERAREYRHLEAAPNLEREEICAIYRSKGFEGALLDRIVDTITSNRDVWVAVMMAEEHQLPLVDRPRALKAGAVVGLSAIVGSMIPLVPFVLLPVTIAMGVSILVTTAALFAVGAYKARVMVGHPARSGLEMAIIGTIAALIGYAVGVLLKVPAVP